MCLTSKLECSSDKNIHFFVMFYENCQHALKVRDFYKIERNLNLLLPSQFYAMICQTTCNFFPIIMFCLATSNFVYTVIIWMTSVFSLLCGYECDFRVFQLLPNSSLPHPFLLDTILSFFEYKSLCLDIALMIWPLVFFFLFKNFTAEGICPILWRKELL